MVRNFCKDRGHGSSGSTVVISTLNVRESKDIDCDSRFIHEVSEHFRLLCLASKIGSPLIFKHLRRRNQTPVVQSCMMGID